MNWGPPDGISLDIGGTINGSLLSPLHGLICKRYGFDEFNFYSS